MVRSLSKFASAKTLCALLMAWCLVAFTSSVQAADPVADAATAAADKVKAAAKELLDKDIETHKAKAGPAGPMSVDVFSFKAENGLYYTSEAAYQDELAIAAIYAKHPASGEAVPAPAGKKLDSGDTAWILVSAALVLLMTGPGLALFYSGLVRRKNVLATMMQSFILMAIVSVVWALVGYSLAFSEGNAFIGGFRFAMLAEVGGAPVEYAGTIPHQLWMIFQCMFAIITPALICGAYAERMKFSSMVIFSILWLLVVYCPMAHMVWAKGGLLNAWNGGKILSIDFAGGTVVHIA